MHTWTIRAATLAAIAAAALFGAAVSSNAGVAAPSWASSNGFAGPVVSHAVRPIDRDLTPASSARLRLVACAAPASGRQCFAASSR